MILTRQKQKQRRPRRRPRTRKLKTPNTRFSSKVQYGPTLYQGYFSAALGADPMGLYQKDVHFYFTYYLARYLCLDMPSGYKYGRKEMSVAYMLAWNTQRVDDDFTTTPVYKSKDGKGHTVEGIGSKQLIKQRARFHLVPGKDGQVIVDDAKIRAALNKQAVAGKFAKFGVLAHIYEDTFSHQGFGPKVGHASDSTVDIPYKHPQTAKFMAMAMYRQMFALAKNMKVCCDLKKRSFTAFWQRVSPILLVRQDNVNIRIAGWKSFLKTDPFSKGTVHYKEMGAKDSRQGWVKAFRESAKVVPEKWY